MSVERKFESFHPMKTRVYAAPSLTTRIAPLLHAAGGGLLIAGMPGAAFYLLCTSLIIHLLDANAHPSLNWLGGKKTGTILGSFSAETDSAPACVIVLSPCAQSETAGRKILLYRMSFLAGTALLLMSLISLLTGGSFPVISTVLTGASLLGTAAGGIWKTERHTEKSGRLTAGIASSLVPAVKGTWVFVLPDNSFPLPSRLLKRYRGLLLPAAFVFVSASPRVPKGQALATAESWIVWGKGKGKSIIHAAKDALKNSGLDVTESKNVFDPNLLYASSRGFTSISITFSTEEDPVACAKALKKLADSLNSSKKL